jgi:hypothetical protein
MRAVEIQRGPALRTKAIELADSISRKWLDRWRAEAAPAAETLYVEAMRRFADLANDALGRLATLRNAALAFPARNVTPEIGFTERSRLHFTSLMTRAPSSAGQWLLDLVRSREQQLRVLDRRIGDYLEALVVANANRIVGDFNDRVLESRRRFEADVRSALGEVATSAEFALARAKEHRAQGSQAVQHEMLRINALSDRLAALGLNRKAVRS